jgi:hypothetical protein
VSRGSGYRLDRTAEDSELKEETATAPSADDTTAARALRLEALAKRLGAASIGSTVPEETGKDNDESGEDFHDCQEDE